MATPQGTPTTPKKSSSKRKRDDASVGEGDAAGGASTDATESPSKRKAKSHIKGDKYQLSSMMEGTSVETALTMKLPDYLAPGLDIIFIGINPGVVSAARGHHYFNPTNHFWPLMHESGLIDEPMKAKDDARCLSKGFGLTNMVARTSHASCDLSTRELRDGAKETTLMIQTLKPKVACFNGKGIYEIFSGTKKCSLGRQPNTIPDTDVTVEIRRVFDYWNGSHKEVVYVMPSSSARAATFPKKADKLRFFVELKEIVAECKTNTSPYFPT